jgi:hypothetical protein
LGKVQSAVNKLHSKAPLSADDEHHFEVYKKFCIMHVIMEAILKSHPKTQNNCLTMPLVNSPLLQHSIVKIDKLTSIKYNLSWMMKPKQYLFAAKSTETNPKP